MAKKSMNFRKTTSKEKFLLNFVKEQARAKGVPHAEIRNLQTRALIKHREDRAKASEELVCQLCEQAKGQME